MQRPNSYDPIPHHQKLVRVLLFSSTVKCYDAVGEARFDDSNTMSKKIEASRRPSALFDLSKKFTAVKVIELDVECDSSIEYAFDEVSKVLKDQPLSLLINNAGYDYPEGTILGQKPNRANINRQFDTNTTSHIMLTHTFLPLLLKARKDARRSTIVNISSGLGSVKNAESVQRTDDGDFWYAYNMSKASLNMYTRVLAKSHKKNGLIVVAIHPGKVKTDMGGPKADIEVEESIERMVETLAKMSIEDSGRFIDRFGVDIPF